MATQSKIIGRVPVSRQEYIKGMTCFKDNIVTCYGSAFQCTVDSTTTPPATLDASGALVLGAGWIFFADASAARKADNRIFALERDFGQYAELPSVAMTAETTGKYINADGEFVDDADFNIAAIGAVVVGNTYELYMGVADKMKLGVALFVARIKTTTTSGTERIEYVPLFSAMSTDIPTSGYVCFEAMEAYSDVLVCYRADVPEAATLRVRRYGTKASIATQINNLRKKVDLKSFTDGYYESMRVGTADNLTSKGDATEEVIMSRKAGGDNQIEDGSASIKRIKGYSVISNQLFDKNHPISSTTARYEKNGDIIKYYPIGEANSLGSTGWSSGWALIYNTEEQRLEHKIYIQASYTRIAKRTDKGEFEPTDPELSPQSMTFKAELGIPTVVRAVVTVPSGEHIYFSLNDCVVDLADVQVIDLTQMFGSGNEPSTPEAFAKRLGYSSIDNVPYIPYNEGEIVPSFAEGIKTTDTEGKVSERKWSETLKKYFPDGLKSAGSAYDEITPTKAVKRIGAVNLGDIVWVQGGLNNKTSWVPNVFNLKGTAVLPTSVVKVPNIENNKYIKSTPQNVEGQRQDKTISLNPQGWIYIYDSAYKTATPEQFKQSLQGVMLYYEMATPEETAYDELNLTEQVSEGGTEEAIIADGKTSTPLRADITYPIDAYNTIKANKANIGTLSSLNTASKTDLVSAINELASKVGAIEAKATEATNKMTE